MTLTGTTLFRLTPDAEIDNEEDSTNKWEASYRPEGACTGNPAAFNTADAPT